MVSPFNFTAIGANLVSSPALMGNTVVWKPAATSAFSSYFMFRLLQAAGLPDGVVNLVYGPGALIGDAALSTPQLAGVHFTGSTPVFQGMWKAVADRIADYRAYPRLVGETGGGLHPRPPVRGRRGRRDRDRSRIVRVPGPEVLGGIARLVPKSMWDEVRDRLAEDVPSIAVGDVADFENFMGAVIDEASFRTQRDAIEGARAAGAEIIAGGEVDDSQGWFVRPTVIRTEDLVPAPPRRASSGRSSPRTCTTMHAGTTRSVSSTRRPLRADRGRVRERPGSGAAGASLVLGRQLLRERQADRRGRRAAAVRGSRASGTNDKAGSMAT